ncbi:helix-turn-helix domain-containing protein [Psychroserpens ponticola]|uniref:Helix-turn-helix transcriptional regulator n=1 Tax=Psychroserpens ponticola TaxID=2932268 RepID=A0ABY7S039_9FLAO|nr:helix-turn-helix transcriptional regulator [Psychroserpens ponticola]WCO02301.1 helix-turn-helix transcriptional regulator [Psychroserpens ponticola]
MGSLDIILITISGAGLMHGILVSIHLLTNKKNQTLSKSLMAIILLLMAFRVGKSVLFNFAEDLEFSIIMIGLSVLLLLGPLLYFYIQSITTPNFQLKKSYVNYFSPFVAMFVISFFATEQWFIENGKFWSFLLLAFVYLHFAYYIIRSSKIVMKASKEGNQVLTKSQNTVILWSKYVIVGVIIIWLSYVLNIFEDKIPYILGPVIYSITIYALTFIAFNLRVINYDGMVFKEDLNKNTLFKNIDAIIRKDKLYLNSNLDLTQIAKVLSVSIHEVSHMINEKTDTNFNGYINKFRIEEAKKIISKDKAKQYTIESIAYDVGFNSMSTFNSAFKKLESTTPSQYRNSLS